MNLGLYIRLLDFEKPGLYEVKVKRLLDFAQYPLQTKNFQTKLFKSHIRLRSDKLPNSGLLTVYFKMIILVK